MPVTPAAVHSLSSEENITIETRAAAEFFRCAHCGFPLRRRHKTNSLRETFCCYGCAFASQMTAQSPDGKNVSWIMVKLGAAAFLAMNVMGFALAMHASSVYPDFYRNISEGGKIYDQLLRYVLLMMSAPVFFMIGVPLLENVVHEARAGRWGVEGFIAAGVFSAAAYSMVSTIRGWGPVYYDVAVMVLVFLTLGRYLEARFRFKTVRSLENLLEEKKETACRLTAEGESRVSVRDIQPGDILILRAGERIPVDGTIVEGAGVLEMAAMTGEFLPVTKRTGETLWAGAILTEGFLKMAAAQTAGDSWLARLRETLQAARQSKTAIEQTADKVIYFMTGLTVLSALMAFILGMQSHGLMAGLLRALAVLVIVCPCALGAAIPLSLWKSFGKVTQRGVLFHDLGRLETLASVRGVFFDKTGTLTEPLPQIESIENLSDISPESVLRLAACIAQSSTHPFSRALVREAGAREWPLEFPADVKIVTGEGVSGILNGRERVYIGNSKFLFSEGLRMPPNFPRTEGRSEVCIGWNREIRARIFFKEKIRNEAAEVLAVLRKSGLQLGLLTGDSMEAAKRIGEELGLDVEYGLSPEDKWAWIRRWEQEHGPALVVGEGLNDAPMLAAAGVSLALGGAFEKTREEADFILPDDDLSAIPWLIATARGTLARIKKNLFWAFFYNLLALPAAVAGWVNPIVAAAAMIASSFLIMIQALQTER